MLRVWLCVIFKTLKLFSDDGSYFIFLIKYFFFKLLLHGVRRFHVMSWAKENESTYYILLISTIIIIIIIIIIIK